ncbi:MAG TPA: isochorismate synthase [Chloroflexota bacterium]|jgi:isochorismate synthase|nr:isochorismate synthase [Chloroflexota bacterium]
MLADAVRGTALSLTTTTRPIAPFDALALFARAHGQERALWLRPSGDEAIVGIGAAHVIALDGTSSDRFAIAARMWRELVYDIEDPAPRPWTGPLLLGGFRFDPLRTPTDLWSGFAADRLVLPERLYVQHGESAWLTTSRLVGAAPGVAEAPPLPSARGLSPAAWQGLVGSVAGDIRVGTAGVGKVVLARAHTVAAQAPLEPAVVLQRLANTYPTCTIVGIGHAAATFVAATPERLVSVGDGLATTMALAASAPRGGTDTEDRTLGEALLRDPKERAEHEFVVQALRDGLGEVSSRVVADAEPRLRKLPNLQHLLTRVHANLRPGYSILDVVQRLHPSPAVGGVPTSAALALIRDREALDRGWYGGPIGWLNSAGEGEFVVGIRSALLRGREATLFAGCGIVADSNPSAELAESNWKLRPMLSALGIADGT